MPLSVGSKCPELAAIEASGASKRIAKYKRSTGQVKKSFNFETVAKKLTAEISLILTAT